MKHAISGLIGIVFCLQIAGCATPSSSSGLLLGKDTSSLPKGVPKRVGVILGGEYPINEQASDQFAAGLLEIGFDVLERQKIKNILKEYKLELAGLISDETAIEIGKLLGLQGIFLGTVTGESSPLWVDSHVNVRLVEVDTGKIIWAANTNDPRTFTISMDVKTSVIHSTKEALRLLKKDLYNK